MEIIGNSIKLNSESHHIDIRPLSEVFDDAPNSKAEEERLHRRHRKLLKEVRGEVARERRAFLRHYFGAVIPEMRARIENLRLEVSFLVLRKVA
ncbi:hypothetical protein [Rhodocaloribacter sp.]